jgi:hypothetical protein
MKVIYEFNDDDREELEIFQQSRKIWVTMWEMNNEFRKWIKYNEKELNGDQLDALDKFRQRFLDIVKENNVNLDL